MAHTQSLTPSCNTIEAALGLWGLTGARFQLAAQRENQVFKVEADGALYALRFHRPGYRSGQELASELAWTRMLAEAGIAVPGVVSSQSGRLLERVDGWQVDLLDWLDAAPMGQSNRLLERPDKPLVYRRLGEAMARLHAASDAWLPPPGFQRWAWDRAGLVGQAPLWDRFWENPALADADRRLFSRFRDVATQELVALEPSLDYGLIHADLVRENVLVAGRGGGQQVGQEESLTLALIDFDDSGYGFRLFEIATALLKITAEPDFEASKAAMLEGYLSRRSLDLTHLPLFLALRAASYVGWIVSRLAEPGAPERQQRFIETARRQIEAYLGAE